MRLKVVPEGWLERIAFRLRLVPRPLLEMTGGVLLSRAVMAGVRLGLFDAVEKGAADAQEIASRIGCSREGVEVLVLALAASDYLRRDASGRFVNAPMTRRWLLSDAPESVAPYVLFMYDQWRWVDRLEEFIRTGRAAEIHAPGQGPDYWDRYMGALAAIARTQVGTITRAIPLAGRPRRMLDVAGGHGVFSEALCRRYPDLVSDVLDLEDAARAGRALVASRGLGARIRHRSGDLRTSTWGSGYDLVLLFNILHHLTDEECRDSARKARAALVPGGTLAVWDFLDTASEARPGQVGGLMSLFFFATSGRRTHSRERIRGWLRDAGFREIRCRRPRRAPFGVLVTGRSPRLPY